MPPKGKGSWSGVIRCVNNWETWCYCCRNAQFILRPYGITDIHEVKHCILIIIIIMGLRNCPTGQNELSVLGNSAVSALLALNDTSGKKPSGLPKQEE